jgi:hypothetical protein
MTSLGRFVERVNTRSVNLLCFASFAVGKYMDSPSYQKPCFCDSALRLRPFTR